MDAMDAMDATQHLLLSDAAFAESIGLWIFDCCIWSMLDIAVIGFT